jgi:hypothetical protein
MLYLLLPTTWFAAPFLHWMQSSTGSFFLTMALLAIYNYFNIRRNIEEFTKPVIIAYVISWVGILFLFYIAHNQL